MSAVGSTAGRSPLAGTSVDETQNTGGFGSFLGTVAGSTHDLGFFFAAGRTMLRWNTVGLAATGFARRAFFARCLFARLCAALTTTAPGAQPLTIGPLPLSSWACTA